MSKRRIYIWKNGTELIALILRLRKIHAFALLLVLLCVLFAFALRADPTRQTLWAPQTRQLPIVMYHHVLPDLSRAGRYVLPVRQLEEDLLYLQSCGYTSVNVGDLAAFVNGKRDLPEKIVMLTFDDGYQSAEDYVLPLLEQTDMKAVLAVVGQFAQTYTDSGDTNVRYACLSWDALRRLHESGRFELQSHTYNLHSNRTNGRRGLAQKSGESEEAYRAMLTADLMKNQEAIQSHTGATPTALVYPYGAFSPATTRTAKDCGFLATLTCEEQINTVTPGDPDCLYGLGRFNRPAGKESAAFFKKLGIVPAEKT